MTIKNKQFNQKINDDRLQEVYNDIQKKAFNLMINEPIRQVNKVNPNVYSLINFDKEFTLILIYEQITNFDTQFRIVSKINHNTLLQGNSYYCLNRLDNLLISSWINKEEYIILKNFFLSYK